MKFIGVLTDTKRLYFDRPIIINSDNEDNAIQKIKMYFLKNGTKLDTEDANYKLINITSEENAFTID